MNAHTKRNRSVVLTLPPRKHRHHHEHHISSHTNRLTHHCLNIILALTTTTFQESSIIAPLFKVLITRGLLSRALLSLRIHQRRCQCDLFPWRVMPVLELLVRWHNRVNSARSDHWYWITTRTVLDPGHGTAASRRAWQGSVRPMDLVWRRNAALCQACHMATRALLWPRLPVHLARPQHLRSTSWLILPWLAVKLSAKIKQQQKKIIIYS